MTQLEQELVDLLKEAKDFVGQLVVLANLYQLDLEKRIEAIITKAEGKES